MAVPPDDLLARQEAEVARYADARARRVMSMLETARRQIQGIIADADSFTAQRVAFLVRQIDALSAQLARELNSVGSSSPELAGITQRHLQESIAAIADLQVLISVDALNLESLRLFSSNEVARMAKLIDAEKEVIRSVLFTKVGVKGENPVKVARQLAGKESQFAGRFAHIENILRTETSTVYNRQSLAGIQAANEQYDLGLNKKIVETIDAKRNHPISMVLNGQVQRVDRKFKASVSKVQAAAAKIKKSVGGTFWKVEDGFYTGMVLPAHYRERGIVVPTDEPVNAP